MSGRFWRLAHFWAMIVWVVLLIPTLLWWRESLVWIVFMSWYAIVVSHFASWQAARVEEKADAP